MSAPSSRGDKPRRPKLRHFKARDKGYIEIYTRRIYMPGKYRSTECMAEYKRACKELKNHGQLVTIGTDRVTVAQIVAAFLDHAESYYFDADRRTSSEVYNFRSAVRPLLKLFIGLPAEDLSPLKLEEVRDLMIAKGWNRNQINDQMSRIRMIIKWAVSKEMISENVLIRLKTISPLKAGRSTAPEPKKVRPVGIDFVRSIYPHLSTQVQTILELLIQTGARVGEILQMRRSDITIEKGNWWYTPAKHKTQHHGLDRSIFLNDIARRVIQPFLTDRPVDAYLFDPAEAERQLREQRRAERVTPFHGKTIGSELQPIGEGDRTFCEKYDTAGIGLAIRRACDKTYPPPAHLTRLRGETNARWMTRLTEVQRAELKAWWQDHRFHAHQIRHSVLTEVARQHGIDAARAVGGHQHVKTTAIYAERDRQTASKAVAGLW